MSGEVTFRCFYILHLIKEAHQTHLGSLISKEERVIFMGIILYRKIRSRLWNAQEEDIHRPPLP